MQKRYWLTHRADFQKLLFVTVLADGTTVTLGAYVMEVDQENIFVTPHDGTVLSADVIVGADCQYNRFILPGTNIHKPVQEFTPAFVSRPSFPRRSSSRVPPPTARTAPQSLKR